MRCRVGCYQLVPGPLRAEDDAAEPPRRMLRVGGANPVVFYVNGAPWSYATQRFSVCVCVRLFHCRSASPHLPPSPTSGPLPTPLPAFAGVKKR